MTPTLKWADLNPVGRTLIVVVILLTLGIAAVSFAISYDALYSWVLAQGLYTGRAARVWPLTLDAAFIVAQVTAIIGGILRGQRGWPLLTMAISGALTLWFNLQHAGADPGRRLAAIVPPVMMILAFECDIQIVKWVMKALGRPLNETTALVPHGYQLPSPGPVPGVIYRPDLAPYGAVPPPFGTPPPAVPNPGWPAGQMPTPTSSEKPQIGQPGLGLGGTTGNGHQGETTKRQQVEAHLARLNPEQLDRLTARQLAADLTDRGMDVSERYVLSILDAWNATRRGSGAPARRPRKR